MKTNRITLFALVLGVFILFVGCKKDKTKSTASSTTDPCIGMLYFNSSEEFVETQQWTRSTTASMVTSTSSDSLYSPKRIWILTKSSRP